MSTESKNHAKNSNPLLSVSYLCFISTSQIIDAISNEIMIIINVYQKIYRMEKYIACTRVTLISKKTIEFQKIRLKK